MTRVGAALAAFAGAAVATRGARVTLARATGTGEKVARWTRVNHRGAEISLLEGPAVGMGLLVGAVVGATAAPRLALAGALAATGGAAFGLVDDLSEDTSRTRKGLRGHLGALAHGELTTGGLKVVGIGATSVAAAAVLHGRPVRGGIGAWVGDVLTSGALVAATANLLNLLDLRPGRALKAGALAAVPTLAGAGAPLGAACVGAAAAALGPDLAERDMLGDGGANALGALIGTAAVASSPRPLRLTLLAGAVALTFASERVSFTDVIARTPALRAIDEWGRR